MGGSRTEPHGSHLRVRVDPGDVDLHGLLGDAFGGWVIPALGFLLLPWTTLTYSCVWAIGSDTVSGWEWIGLAIALLVDYTFLAWSRNAFD